MRNQFTVFLFFCLLGNMFAFAEAEKVQTPPGAFVDVDGGQLYYQECGTGSEAVVLLHDGVVNSAVWDDAWPAFCKRFHTLRYDRRGYGHSSATKKPYYEADDLAALLRDRKISHAALVASSHGGQVAMEFSLRYAEFVRDLVLVGPGVSGFPYSENFLKREFENSKSDKVADLIAACVQDKFLIVPGHDAARKRLQELLTASPQDLTHNDMPLPEKPIFPYLRDVRVPTLILIGSGDIADNEAVAGALLMTIPGATWVVVGDTGHLMYLEKPDEFFSLVNSFLTAHGL